MIKKIQRLFSKRSGFTLVEIIVAFAVFAVMTTMIMQILNSVSLQRRWNNEFSREIDRQEGILVTDTKEGYEGGSYDGNLYLDFGDGTVLQAGYQMKGTGANAEVENLAYFVTEELEPSAGGSGDGTGSEIIGGGDSNTGSVTDRVKTRITGTKGFSYIEVKQVVNCGKDKDGNTVYAIEVCAATGTKMSADDIPYANYRLYFCGNGGKGTATDIVYAKYLNSSFSADNVAGMINDTQKTREITSGGSISNSPMDPENLYVVAICSDNGLRIGSPFKSGSGGNNWNNGGGNNNEPTLKYKICSECGTIFHGYNDWDMTTEDGAGMYRQCPASAERNTYFQCANYLQNYTPPVEEPDEPETPEPDTEPGEDEDDSPWTGNGVKFVRGNTTKFLIAFKNDPGLSEASFGSNGVAQPDGSYRYYADSSIGDITTGPNIYGAFPI